MRIVKFEGATMRDALAKVKAELGDQAVIVSTRQIKRGLLGGAACEISAATDEADADDPPMRTPRFAPPPPARDANSEVELEKAIGPMRSELRSLRALVRTANDGRAHSELRAEVAALRALVEKFQPAAPTAVAHAPSAVRIPERKPASPTARMQADGVKPNIAPSNSRIVMIVGPTGAGKTTTIAKLAARAALIDQRTVGLVTLDHYRVGGVDQIRTFADLIGVPLQIAASAAGLAEILELDDSEQIYIDTAGRSPRDSAAINELVTHLTTDIEVHLAIPATTSPAMIDDLVARYSPLQPQRLLFTKLDEIGAAPELLHAPVRTRLPITYITTGQAVPEDLEEPTAARVIELASRGLRANAEAA